MARIVKDYDERYAEFLQVAQQLFFSKGYDKTSVQDIINEVGVAKGTFYHYFGSKVDILDALVHQRMERMVSQIAHIVDDETLNPVEKFEKFFGHINQWKIRSKPFLLQTAKVMFQDENVLLREKMQQGAAQVMIPLLAEIIQQGADAGMFGVVHPLETAEVVFMIPRIFGESLIPMLISEQHDADMIEHIKRQITVYNQSVERVLGMTDAMLNLFDTEILDFWLSDNN